MSFWCKLKKYIYIIFFLGTFKHGWKIGTRAWRKWDKSGLGRYFCSAPQSSKFEENSDSHYVILCTWAQDQLSFVLGMAFTCKPKFELVLTSIIMLFKIHANGISIITQARDKKSINGSFEFWYQSTVILFYALVMSFARPPTTLDGTTSMFV